MNWLELVIEMGAGDCERVENALLECGAQALTLNDAGDEPVLEPLPGETPVWPHLRLTALFAEDVNQEMIESTLNSTLPAAFRQWRTLKDQQWERVWLSRFKPRQFGKRLWVIPSGSEPKGGDAISLLLDPGLAFGTGDHPTTDLCLQWLDDAPVEGKRVLDYGHGSGILAIAAHKLGATDVLGIDIDPQAVIAGNDNAARNSVTSHMRFITHDVDEQFDVIIANILAGPLVNMAARICAYLVEGGHIALSGLLSEQTEQVMTAYAPWITWSDTRILGDWALVCGVRNSRSAE
ncbi:MAG: 50S ribosomal protein L11 methyltransferase [Gammaproteobacteria bacterium]